MKKCVFALLALTLVTATGCPSPPGLVGRVLLRIDSATPKTFLPAVEAVVFDIVGSGPYGASFELFGVTETTKVFEDLIVGQWTISVDARNEGALIASGETSVVVAAGETTEASVTVVPVEGDGSLRIDFSWPEGILSDPSVSGSLSAQGGSTASIPFSDPSVNAVSYTYESLAAGGYTLIIRLMEAGEEVAYVVETGVVYANLATEAEVELRAEDLNTPPAAPTELAAVAVSSSQIDLNWTDASITEEGFHIERKEAEGEFAPIGTTAPNVTTYSDTSVVQGTLYTYRVGAYNRFGSNYSPAAAVFVDMRIVGIACGPQYSLAVRGDGTVWAWGWNDGGQLGDGTTTDRLSPVRVSGVTDAVAVSSGRYFALALSQNGTVWAWGWNGYGQLGDGTTTDRLSPVRVLGISDAVGISAGTNHALAVIGDGTVMGWGANDNGQIGDGTNTDRHIPVQVVDLTDVASVSAGRVWASFYSHSLAVGSDGRVWAWGMGSHGQLGQGDGSWSTTPVEVPGLAGAMSVAACGWAYWPYSLALMSDSALWGWGRPLREVIGAGDSGDVWYYAPVAVTALTGSVSCIAAGGFHALALKSDGAVVAWGGNSRGQLGDGTTTDRYPGVDVIGLTDPIVP